METLLGIKGPDFVMLAADCTQAHSIIMMKEGKLQHNLNKRMILHKIRPLKFIIFLFIYRRGQNS